MVTLIVSRLRSSLLFARDGFADKAAPEEERKTGYGLRPCMEEKKIKMTSGPGYRTTAAMRQESNTIIILLLLS